jgi:hypothetical protein
MYTQIQTGSYIQNIFSILGLFEGTGVRRERKRESQESENTDIHCVCIEGRHEETH